MARWTPSRKRHWRSFLLVSAFLGNIFPLRTHSRAQGFSDRPLSELAWVAIIRTHTRSSFSRLSQCKLGKVNVHQSLSAALSDITILKTLYVVEMGAHLSKLPPPALRKTTYCFIHIPFNSVFPLA
ncbi:UNVERIFIED_CONTAM: hypothetical protein K2H54_023337 [Gekko kuhli]